LSNVLPWTGANWCHVSTLRGSGVRLTITFLRRSFVHIVIAS
jgi:hypothetical protein